MKKFSYQYLIGVLFFLFGLYQLYINQLVDTILYVSVGLGFIVMALIKDEVFPKHKKILNILSWVLIILGCFSFLYVVTIQPYEQ